MILFISDSFSFHITFRMRHWNNDLWLFFRMIKVYSILSKTYLQYKWILIIFLASPLDVARSLRQLLHHIKNVKNLLYFEDLQIYQKLIREKRKKNPNITRKKHFHLKKINASTQSRKIDNKYIASNISYFSQYIFALMMKKIRLLCPIISKNFWLITVQIQKQCC